MILSESEIQALKASMLIVRSDIRGHGAAFFEKLFEEHPEWQDKFPAWKGSSMAQVKNSVRLRAHGTSVFCDIDKWILSLDDAEVFGDLMFRSGNFHRGKQIDIQYFEKIGPFMVTFLRGRLGGQFTGEMARAWEAFWPKVVDGLRSGM